MTCKVVEEKRIKVYIKCSFCCLFSQESYWDLFSVNKARSDSIFVP